MHPKLGIPTVEHREAWVKVMVGQGAYF